MPFARFVFNFGGQQSLLRVPKYVVLLYYQLYVWEDVVFRRMMGQTRVSNALSLSLSISFCLSRFLTLPLSLSLFLSLSLSLSLRFPYRVQWICFF